MNRKQFIGTAIAVLVSSTLSFGLTTSNDKNQCTAMTKKNVQCKNNGNKHTGLCYLHDPTYVKKSDNKTTICLGFTKSGNKCKLKTKNGSGYCHHHLSQCENCDEID